LGAGREDGSVLSWCILERRAAEIDARWNEGKRHKEKETKRGGRGGGRERE